MITETLLWQRCTVKRRSIVDYTEGTPNYSDVTVATGIPCRLDTDESSLRQPRDMAGPGSFSEKIDARLFMNSVSGLDNTMFIIIDGDTATYEVVFIHRKAGFAELSHLEIEVRAMTNR